MRCPVQNKKHLQGKTARTNREGDCMMWILMSFVAVMVVLAGWVMVLETREQLERERMF